MKSLICEYCGSGSFHKMESYLICDYCGAWKPMIYSTFSDEQALFTQIGDSKESCFGRERNRLNNEL